MRYTITGIGERDLTEIGKVAYYLQVEQKLRITGRIEKVWINPISVPINLDTSKSKVGDIVERNDTRFIHQNIHAVACRCSKCIGVFKKIIEKAEGQGTTIIDIHGKTSEEVAKEISSLRK